jgi:hypothetical protein
MADFECFCGESFGDREELIQHNVDQHQMTMDESRQKVLDKYPAA